MQNNLLYYCLLLAIPYSRGTQKSEGNFTIWHSDADDSVDLGEWIIQQEWSNGVIYSFGASADGLAAFTTNTNNLEWLQAQYYVWSSSIGYVLKAQPIILLSAYIQFSIVVVVFITGLNFYSFGIDIQFYMLLAMYSFRFYSHVFQLRAATKLFTLTAPIWKPWLIPGFGPPFRLQLTNRFRCSEEVSFARNLSFLCEYLISVFSSHNILHLCVSLLLLSQGYI